MAYWLTQNKKLTVTTGTIGNNQWIPVPSGYNRNECKFMVSVKHYDSGMFDMPEMDVSYRYGIDVNVRDDGYVTCSLWNIKDDGGGHNGGWHYGDITLNYICIAGGN